jgi:FtsP/CotA-like multicopper oxidase with cupredoxin domain
MSGPTSILMEEQVGLLKGDDAGRHSFESREEDDSHWKDQATTTPHHTPRRPYVKLVAILVLIACTLGLLLDFIFVPRKHGSESPPAPARLRPEEEYILDPSWDFKAAPTTREYTWVIQDHELNPDGVYRPMVLINATFPGPLIEVNEDDEIVVHVLNRAVNGTSIHWHGLYQNGSNWMDGTVGVTQCPIPPARDFTYRFNVTGQSGTYYYHSHMGMQASDGLVGPLVIHARGGEKGQKVPYGQDRVVMLSDHYYDFAADLLVRYLAPGNENEEPVPPSSLINGRNVRNCSGLPMRNCSSTGLAHALFDVSSTASTRLRVINVGAFAEFSLQIDEHEFQVTEVDGTDVLPQSIHRLNINPAQRYSIIVTPPTDSNKGLYWIRARMITHCFAYEEPELQEEVWGIMHYPSLSLPSPGELTPQTHDWSETIEIECRDLNTTSLVPSIPIPAPGTADHTLSLRVSFQIRDHKLSRGYLNNTSFHTNTTHPILATLLSDPTQTQHVGINTALFNPDTQLVFQNPHISVIDIIIQNFDDGVHPFHLHGYKFWVLGGGHGYVPENIAEGFDMQNPLRRDTASVEGYGWLWVRFVADNPGVWAFHCHVGWHQEAGLGMVFATRVGEIRGGGEVKELCEV